MIGFQTVLHPTDFSSGSAAAFSYACKLAEADGARLIVLTVVAPPIPVPIDGVVVLTEAQEFRALAEKALAEIQAPHPGLRMERRVVEGPTTERILETARTEHADLIVMGTHGRSGFRRLILGSVAEEVARAADCPVLLVKERRGDDAGGSA